MANKSTTAMTTNRPPRRAISASWLRRHRLGAGIASLLLIGASVGAAVLIIQNVGLTPSAKAPDVLFEEGPDYTVINTAGYATLAIGTSGTSATLSLSGIPGASLVQLGDVLSLTNSHATLDYSVTLSRSAAPNAAITGLVFEVYDESAVLVRSFDAASAASATAFTLPAATSYDITVQVTIADGTTVGTLGSFDLEFTLAPA